MDGVCPRGCIKDGRKTKSLNFIHPIVTIKSEIIEDLNTLRTGDADLRFYVTTVQDG